MPFDSMPPPRQRIAVIGAGISGMGAAHMLADTHDVTLFEAENRLGGHARTVIAGKRGDQPVDTGFIVFNYANYPHLARLFDRLDVPVVKSDMSFGASIRGGALEYGLASVNAIFAQRRNVLNPSFLGMLRDVMRFNARALRHTSDPDQTIGEFLGGMGLGPWFRDYYLYPLTGAIWSTPKTKMGDFPAHAMIRFMENHALLNHTGQHQWYTVAGGSVSYVDRLGDDMRRLGVTLRLGCPVSGVRRGPSDVAVRAHGGDWEEFDEVVFATHSDDSLRMLSDATPHERADLGAIRYQPNDIVLHADASVMPRRRAVWSSWNYTEAEARRDGQIDLTYWMNRLQPIPQDDLHFVTLNTNRTIREELIYDQVTLRHPVYDLPALAAQQRVRASNGRDRTWFCGAWLKHGFHEDGLSSAVDVVHGLTGGADRTATAPRAA
ncbi:cyclopropane-fatty-acyl-phospholipid synthase [Roseovarius sp. TE539]|uniref:NAD(P)/FAD-dependent oxidoreductase n=1 Tax=Roseovarius sp. TE539 TaxID=2249812 RepID=UPI000DE028E2|nr:FAD-dependent oxidoreductase [Roseovarius sp. TE539]RBI76064.1 cyclopropane-fatty-acyl-phospholipid synthase [Roseovarius sp. TE539]